jgi:CHRD domain/PEP-CTERM motif
MKKLGALCAVAAASGLLGLTSPAQAVTYFFAAPLTGAAESPPVATTASGSALVTFDDVALSVSVFEIFIGLIGGPATASHIHCCTAVAGVGNSPVALNFTGFPAATTGFYTNTFTLAAGSFSSLLAGAQAGKAYVNIHNTGNPAGEIRGFLIAQVPEPSTYGLLLAGLAAVGLVAGRRKAS